MKNVFVFIQGNIFIFNIHGLYWFARYLPKDKQAKIFVIKASHGLLIAEKRRKKEKFQNNSKKIITRQKCYTLM